MSSSTTRTAGRSARRGFVARPILVGCRDRWALAAPVDDESIYILNVEPFSITRKHIHKRGNGRAAGRTHQSERTRCLIRPSKCCSVHALRKSERVVTARAPVTCVKAPRLRRNPSSMRTTIISVRLPAATRAHIRALAAVYGLSPNDVVTTALARYGHGLPTAVRRLVDQIATARLDFRSPRRPPRGTRQNRLSGSASAPTRK